MKRLLITILFAASISWSPLARAFEKWPRPSVFPSEKIPRDPFERGGVAHKAELVSINIGSEGAEEAQLASFFRVTSYSIDRLAIALINGTAVAEGESFTVETRSGKLRIRLLKVKQNGVVLKSNGTIFNVPITR